MKKFPLIAITILGVLLTTIGSAQSASAVIVDFETGLSEGDMVGAQAVTGNTVTFKVGTPTPMMDGIIAQVGAPVISFVTDDTPADTMISGDFFLTDESMGPSATESYFMEFASPIDNLELDLYDYRTDGGPSVGAVATLTAYADIARTMVVGTDTFTIVGGEVDGNIEHLSIPSPSGVIRAAAVTFSQADVGTGIDNIEFDNSRFVAGSLTPIDTTMVLVAGTHSVAAWMIPVIVSGIGFAIVIARKF